MSEKPDVIHVLLFAVLVVALIGATCEARSRDRALEEAGRWHREVCRMRLADQGSSDSLQIFRHDEFCWDYSKEAALKMRPMEVTNR